MMPKAKKSETKFDLQAVVTAQVVAHLEEVLANGEKCELPFLAAPQRNPISVRGRSYRGINWLLLGMRDAPSGVWGTYDSWKEHGAQVRGGEKGTMVVWWPGLQKRETENKDTGEIETTTFLGTPRYYKVFSAEQVDGFDLAKFQAKHRRNVEALDEPDMIDEAEAALREFHRVEQIDLREDWNGNPCYVPSLDAIRMPPANHFKSSDGRYGVWLHECAHATGAKKRLDRNLSGRFGSQAYAMEEMVAELAAAIGLAALGISNTPRRDHAQYIASWIKVLTNDAKALFTVAAKAQAAVDRILAASIPAEIAEAA